jgi:uncharacterized protein (TIGR02996 family)
VTTEDDFHAALDADPADWQTRLVFADWLQERNDPRAEGYRALGQHRVHPILIQMSREEGEAEGRWVFIFGSDANNSPDGRKRYIECMLPEDWFKKLRKRDHRDKSDNNPWWRYFTTRRQADDHAALVFATLPAEPPVHPRPEPVPKAPRPAPAKKRKSRKG